METVIKIKIYFVYILVSALCLKSFSGYSANNSNELKIVTEKFYNYIRMEVPNDLIIFPDNLVEIGPQQYKLGLQNEDIYLNISQLINKYVKRVEEHKVQTEDGYELTLIRIPNEGPVVFLMHGLMGSSDDWVLAGTESGIAYLLANEGCDVWMGNARGNKHSRKHLTRDPLTYTFWDFSWDDIGRYDVPASIDYVLEVTNQTQLIYVGHSQGTTSFLVMCSELVQYNEKVSLMIALTAPTAIPNMKSPFLNFIKYVTLFHPEMLFALAREIGFYEFLQSSDLLTYFQKRLCGTIELAQIICNNFLSLFSGFNPSQVNMTNLPVVFAHTPSGAATKQIEHFAQTAISGKFRRFDYGKAKNLVTYGSKTPPEYPLENVTVPIALFYSDNDWLVAVEDVEILRKRLHNVVDYYRVPHDGFNHVDYLFGLDLKTLVYDKMLMLMKDNVNYFN